MDKQLIEQEIKRSKYHLDCHRALYKQAIRKGEPDKAESHSLQAGTWQAIRQALESLL